MNQLSQEVNRYLSIGCTIKANGDVLNKDREVISFIELRGRGLIELLPENRPGYKNKS